MRVSSWDLYSVPWSVYLPCRYHPVMMTEPFSLMYSYTESSRIITGLRVPFLQGLYVVRILTPDKSSILKKEFIF